MRGEISCSKTGKSVHIFGGLKEENVILFSLERTDDQHTEVDVMTKIELSPSGKVFKLEVEWRPDLFIKSKAAIRDYRDILLANDLLDLSESFVRHLHAVRSMKKLAVEEVFTDIMSAFDIDVDWSNNAKIFKENMQSLYINNYLFVNDIINYFTDCMISFSEKRYAIMLLCTSTVYTQTFCYLKKRGL